MKGYEAIFDGIQSIFDQIRDTQGESIEQAAELIAEAVIQDGLVHIFGTGHSNAIAEEAGTNREGIVITFIDVERDSYARGGVLMADKK